MFIRNLLIITILITISSAFTPAQQLQRKEIRGSIIGKVLDSNVNAPIEYANIILFSSKDSLQIAGGVTDKDGRFTINNVPPGKYYMEVKFIGYEKMILENVSLSVSEPNRDVGHISIKPSAITTRGIVIEGERTPMTYRIDKKVINVSKMATTASGNAAELLENVPSINVDVQGNVNLRGSSNFTVLIDSRPSVMSSQDILQHTPASSIQTIEIITNPSAKYDPEGTSGIINIILKKNQNQEICGIINGNAGLNDKYGGDLLFQYKTPFVNYSIGLDYNRRVFSGDSKKGNIFFTDNLTSYLNSTGNDSEGNKSLGIRGILEFNLGEKDFLSFGGRTGNRKFLRNSSLNYWQWTDITSNPSVYLSKNSINMSDNFYAFNINYLRKFDISGQEFSGEIFVSKNKSDESTTSSEINDIVQFGGKRTTESGPESRIRCKLDYTFPLSDKAKFEAGSQGETRLEKLESSLYEFNPSSNNYEFVQKYSNDIQSNLSDLAIYSIYSNEWGRLGFQGGIRTEYTFRSIAVNISSQKFNISRWDYFPSFHTSYNFTEATQFIASYTRRIDRPNSWSLEPFETWMSDKDVRKGNPALKPQFIDSYEFGIRTIIAGISISNEWYYRFTKNRINMIYSIFPGSENITLTTFQNVGSDYSLGSEFMFSVDPYKFWNVNLMGNLYSYKIEGELNSISFSKNSVNWITRLNNNFRLSSSTLLQVNTMYNSPTVSSQEKRKESFTADISIRQEFMNRNILMTLQLRDILRTAKRESSSEGNDFYNYSYYKRESPVVMLNVRLNINNFKNNDRLEGLDTGFDEEDD